MNDEHDTRKDRLVDASIDAADYNAEGKMSDILDHINPTEREKALIDQFNKALVTINQLRQDRDQIEQKLRESDEENDLLSKTITELRERFPTTANIMAYGTLLRKYKESEAACAAMRRLLDRYGAVGPTQTEIVSALDSQAGKSLLAELEALKTQVESLKAAIGKYEAGYPSRFNSITVMRLYDEKLKAHSHFKRAIDGTPFRNDCACIAWEVVKEILES